MPRAMYRELICGDVLSDVDSRRNTEHAVVDLECNSHSSAEIGMNEFSSKIALAVVSTLVGAASTYALTSYAKSQEEMRRQRTESYLNYLKASEEDDLDNKIYTRNVVLAFGSGNVIAAMADGLRADALRLAGDKQDEIRAHPQDFETIRPWVNMLQQIRSEYTDDRVSDEDMLTLMCPDPRYTCYQVWYSKHLFP